MAVAEQINLRQRTVRVEEEKWPASKGIAPAKTGQWGQSCAAHG